MEAWHCSALQRACQWRALAWLRISWSGETGAVTGRCAPMQAVCTLRHTVRNCASGIGHVYLPTSERIRQRLHLPPGLHLPADLALTCLVPSALCLLSLCVAWGR